MKDHAEHTNSPLIAADIENVMAEYEYFINKSDIGPVVKVDTSADSPDETLLKIVNSIEPHLTKVDLDRIANHGKS